MEGWVDGQTDGAISSLDEWVGVVNPITAGYHMLPQGAVGYLYRYV